MRDKARRWLHNSRCSDSHEDRAFIQYAEDAIQLEWHFAEPADMRANPAAAIAPGKFGWRIVGVRVTKRRSAASVTAALEEFPMHVNSALRSSLLVKVIHVLRAEEEAFPQLLFESGEGDVRRIRLCRCRDTPTHGIELPDQPGIASPRIRRGYFFDPIVPPESTYAPESWDAAFRAHSCPGKNKDAVC